MKNYPKVSVITITYGHESYIEETLKSVLNQNYPGIIEFIIANDNSPDNTDRIISDYFYVNKTPDNFIIKLTNHKTNKGMMPNFIWAMQQATGKYMALCEGDDYWIDPLKLLKQVDFLERNLDYNLVMGKYNFYYENRKIFKNSRETININRALSLKDYLAFNFGHTSTFLFRNNLEIPEWFKNVHAGDQSLVVIICADKKIKYLNDVLSVYRINNQSVSNNVNAEKSRENIFYFLSMVNEYTAGKFVLLIKHRMNISKVYYYLEKTKIKLNIIVLTSIIFFMRWFGSNVLVKFIKD